MKSHIILFLLLIFNQHPFSLFGQSRITALEARLFYNENRDMEGSKDVAGNFSENVIGNADFSLWNTVIGEGSAEGMSNQTVVIVKISSSGLSNKDQVLKLTATEGKKVLLQQQKTFACVGDKTTYELLFLLDNTGCEKISLRAELLKAGKAVSVLNRTIEFACGE